MNETADENQIEKVRTALLKSWSIKTSSKWTADNPAKGQCGVTALVVQELLGGEIRKTTVGNGWHFYNIIGGDRFDFTEAQFEEELEYEDLPSEREEALLDTNHEQLRYLRKEVNKVFISAH